VLPIDDVILSTEQIQTSAQNCFCGTVTGVETVDHTVRVSLDCGFPVQALITEYSVQTMKVVPGAEFFVTFKASAIRLY
jgi:molybdopterin-binding protein